MRKNIISILAIIALSCGIAQAIDKPLIDLEFKKIDEEIKRVTSECMKKEKSPIRKIRCGDSLRKKYKLEGKIRGTEEHCEINYKNNSFQELEQLRHRLLRKQDTARHSLDILGSEDRQMGEISKEALQIEIMWIESHLARMQRAKTDRDEKSLKYLPGWGKNNR